MKDYIDINERSINQNITQAIEKNRKLNLEFRLVKLYSVRTGICAEDCGFCGQSRLVEKEYKIIKPFSSMSDIYLAIENAKKNSANEILFVSSGRSIGNKSELKKLAKGIAKARKENLEVGLDTGLMSYDSLSYLFDEGAQIYIGAIQTAKSFFNEIIHSYNYEDKVKVLENAKRIGYHTRSGGILGLGETEKQRYEFTLELDTLPCDSIGLSLFQPMKGTKMQNRQRIDSKEALESLALIRNHTDKPLYLLGGREKVIAEEEMGAALQLINGVTVGDYLFTKGEGIEKIARYIHQSPN